MKGDWSSGMIPASGAGGRGFDSRITPSFLFFGRLPRPSKPLDEPGQHRCVVATCLVSSVRQSVRLLIDWPRVRSPHGVLFLTFFFFFFFFGSGGGGTLIPFCAADRVT
jgi:hypothetical protein